MSLTLLCMLMLICLVVISCSDQSDHKMSKDELLELDPIEIKTINK